MSGEETISIRLASLSPMIIGSLIQGLAHRWSLEANLHFPNTLANCGPVTSFGNVFSTSETYSSFFSLFFLLLRGKCDDRLFILIYKEKKHSGNDDMRNWKQHVPQIWLRNHHATPEVPQSRLLCKKQVSKQTNKQNTERIIILKIFFTSKQI